MFKLENGQTVLVCSKVDHKTMEQFSFFGTVCGKHTTNFGDYFIIEINPYERASVLRELDYSFPSILIHEEYLIKTDICYPDLPDDTEDDTVFQQANRQAAQDLATLCDVVREKTEKIDLARIKYLNDLREVTLNE